jgi:hypothetical protein
VCSMSVRLCVHTVKPPAEDSCLCTGHMQPSALSLHRLGFPLHPLLVVCRCLLLTITPLSVASLPFGLWLPGVLDDEQQRNADYLAGGEPTLCVVAQVGVFLLDRHSARLWVWRRSAGWIGFRKEMTGCQCLTMCGGATDAAINAVNNQRRNAINNQPALDSLA